MTVFEALYVGDVTQLECYMIIMSKFKLGLLSKR